MRNRAHRGGMTLIEVLIVLTIIGIIAGMALPKAAAIQESIELESAAQQVIREMNLAQVRAIKENRTVAFSFPSANQYRIGNDYPRPLPGKLQFPSTPPTIQFASFGPPLSGPATVAIASHTGRTRSVVLTAAGYLSLQ